MLAAIRKKIDSKLEKLISEAEKYASDINNKALADSMEISAASIKEKDRIRRENKQKCEDDIKRMADKLLEEARNSVEKAISEKKQSLRNALLHTAYENVCNLDWDSSRTLMINMLKRHAKSGDTVYSSTRDRALLEECLSQPDFDELRLILSNETSDVDRGFVLQSGDTRTDCSFRSVFNNVVEQEKTAIEKMLFPSADDTVGKEKEAPTSSTKDTDETL